MNTERNKQPMHGLVSLLPADYYAKVEELWQMLEDEFDLTGIQATPFPHFSWLVGEDFNWDELEDTLRQIARETEPLIVNTGGIGIFSGPSPVIFIPVVRTAQLSALHQRIWDAIQPIGMDLSPYYSPNLWMPHITLAIKDVTPRKLEYALQKLVFQTFNWAFEVNNISFIRKEDDQEDEIYYQFNFIAE